MTTPLPPIQDLVRTPYQIELITIAPSLRYASELSFDFNVFLPSLRINLQRDFVWTKTQKSALIESVIYRNTRNIPPMCMVGLGDSHYEVIDGKQRLGAMLGFLRDEFTVSILGGSYKFSQLSKEYREWITRYPINACLAYDLGDDQKVDWFRRINFAGTPQDAKHLKMLQDAMS